MTVMRSVMESAHFHVHTHKCGHPRPECGQWQGGEPARLIFTWRGSFALHVEGETFFARPGQAVLVRKHADYRIAHPDPTGCDCCTDVWIDDETMGMLGLAERGARGGGELVHDIQFQKMHVALLAGLRRGHADPQDAEEAVLDTLEHLLSAHAADRPRLRDAAAARQVARAEEAILAGVGENLSIASLAALAGCSTFRLCRIFRSGTGQSLRQFRMQQRLGAVLGRLGEGEDDLAALACDVGFSSHSHMTDAFGEALGATPSQVREEFRRNDLAKLKIGLRAMRSATA